MKRRRFVQGLAAAIAFLSAAASGFGATVAKTCAKLAPAKRRIILPPIPKWNSAVDGIDQADYVRRSEDFERSFLPRNLVFPREGQIWEAVRDCEIQTRMVRKANTMVWGKVQLRKGDKVRILPLQHPKPLQISFERVTTDGVGHPLWLRIARTVPGQGDQPLYFSDLFRFAES